jgi:hypothetical protein
VKKIASLVALCLMLPACSQPPGGVELHPVFFATGIILILILGFIIEDNQDPPSAA